MDKIRKFIVSNYFLALVFILNVLFWWLKLGIIMMGISSAIAIFIILFDLNRLPLIPLLLANIINYRIAKLEENLWVLIVFAAILAPFIIYDLFKTKPDFKDKIALSMVIFLGINIVSLINTNKNTFGLGLIGVAQVLLYLTLYLYISKMRTKDSFNYIAKNAAFMGTAIFLQMVIKLIMFEGLVITKETLDLGWGMANYVAMVMTVLIPLTVYLYVINQKNKHILLVVCAEFLIIVLTLSKGAFLAWGLAIVPIVIFSCMYAKDKKGILIDGASLLLILALSIFAISKIDFIWKEVTDYLFDMRERGWFTDVNRMELYKKGFDVFKGNPIFGAGSYSSQYYLIISINYHNYIIQSLATLGIVGLIGFGYYMYTIVKGTLVKHFFNVSVLFIIILLSIHGLVDTTWYNPLIMIIISVILPLMPQKSALSMIEEI